MQHVEAISPHKARVGKRALVIGAQWHANVQVCVGAGRAAVPVCPRTRQHFANQLSQDDICDGTEQLCC